MRILYAADNRIGSHLQLKRFLASMKNKKHQIKIAGYRISADELDIDYTLDALLNFSNPKEFYTINDNYIYYYNEIKRFAPDVVISDLEIYTSMIAIELGIKLVQASPILIYYAMSNKIKYNSGIYKYNEFLFNGDERKNKHINYIINSSDKKFVVSHLCDTRNPLQLGKGFSYVRPEFVLSNAESKYDILSILPNYNDDILKQLINKDTKLLNYNDINNYVNIIDGCKVCLSEGVEVVLADAFYNQKYSISIPRHDDIETVICSYMNKLCGIGEVATGKNIDFSSKPFDIVIDDNIKFLSQEVERL